MKEYKGCKIPEDLYYDLDNHVWVKIDNEIAIVGATDPAQAYAGELLNIKIKEVGTKLNRGDIAAIVESAKYMGPMRSPLSGIIVEINHDVSEDPTLINSNPYENWVLKIKPEKLEEEIRFLIKGDEAYEKYKPIIEKWGVDCKK
jgi:glycine cleavage system H protein